MSSITSGNSYLSQLTTILSSTGAGASSTNNSATPATDTGATSLVSSLLSGGSNSYSSQVLSLLQQNASGSFDPVTSLLGGSNPSTGITNLYASLYSSNLDATLGQAKAAGAAAKSSAASTATSGSATTPNTNSINALVNGFTKASQAYNQTNLQSAQSVIDANSYNADGVTALSKNS